MVDGGTSVTDGLLDRWKAIPAVAAHDEDEWEAEPPGHLLHYFRPDGVGLEDIVAGMAHSDEVLSRLRQVFEAARNGRPGDMYFTIRKAPRIRAAELEALARQYLANVIAMAKLVGSRDAGFARRHRAAVTALAGRDVVVEVHAGVPPTLDAPSKTHPLQGFVYETATEFGHLHPPASEHAQLLAEPCYRLACSYELAHFVLWPTRGDGCPIADPFASYFELWRHGASIYFQDDFREWKFEDDHTVRVNVPAV